MDLKTSRDFTIWREGVEILGGGEAAEERLAMLVYGYASSLAVDAHSGSFKDVADQLDHLGAAADAMATALKNLGVVAREALTIASNPGRNERWLRAGGSHLLPALQAEAEKFAHAWPVEAIGRSHPMGCLDAYFRHEEFTALAAFCREEVLLYEGGKGCGLPTAARLLRGSPKMQLAQACAANIGNAGDLGKLNSLVKIVAELLTKKRPSARFAEAECTRARTLTKPPA